MDRLLILRSGRSVIVGGAPSRFRAVHASSPHLLSSTQTIYMRTGSKRDGRLMYRCSLSQFGWVCGKGEHLRMERVRFVALVFASEGGRHSAVRCDELARRHTHIEGTTTILPHPTNALCEPIRFEHLRKPASRGCCTAEYTEVRQPFSKR
jgi:hypothetical protein